MHQRLVSLCVLDTPLMYALFSFILDPVIRHLVSFEKAILCSAMCALRLSLSVTFAKLSKIPFPSSPPLLPCSYLLSQPCILLLLTCNRHQWRQETSLEWNPLPGGLSLVNDGLSYHAHPTPALRLHTPTVIFYPSCLSYITSCRELTVSCGYSGDCSGSCCRSKEERKGNKGCLSPLTLSLTPRLALTALSNSVSIAHITNGIYDTLNYSLDLPLKPKACNI